MRNTREIAAGVCLAILLLANGRRFRKWELRQRAIRLVRTAGLPLEEARLKGWIFSADLEYSEFLQSLRERVPPEDSIAVSVPPGGRPVVYNARYLLAPRAVLPLSRVREADWVALFHADSKDPAAIALPNGALWRVR